MFDAADKMEENRLENNASERRDSVTSDENEMLVVASNLGDCFQFINRPCTMGTLQRGPSGP